MPKSTEEIYKDLLAQGQGYQQQADSLLEQINNRPAFSYNAETDPMFQSVKNQYVHQGQRAMQDTMGQAAGLTGGYGSSYAQAVGNQAYNEYLTQLNAQIPVLAQQARAAYDAEGQDLRDRYALALNAANNAYGQGRDALGDLRYEQERAYNQGRDAIADQRWQMQWDYGKERDAADDAWAREQWEYNKTQNAQSDARSYATYLLQMGIMPSDEQLAAAGITPQEAASIRNYFNAQMAGAYSGGGSGGSGTGSGSGGGSGGSGTGSGSGSGNGTGSGSGRGGSQIPQSELVEFARAYAADPTKATNDFFAKYYNDPDMQRAWKWIQDNYHIYLTPKGSPGGGAKPNLDMLY